MARMIPSVPEEEVRAFRSRAEGRFYEACRTQLPDDVVVIHSAGWIYRDSFGHLREGEADFTILDPAAGILAVEVKGGGVVFEAGTAEWFSVDRSGRRNAIKDPFRQASKERHALSDQILGHPSWRQWRGRRLTLGHAVAFPDLTRSGVLYGPERPREILGFNEEMGSLLTWLKRVWGFWRQTGEDALGSQGVGLVEEILCRSIDVKPVLRSSVDEAEQRRITLTANQAKILRIIGGRKRAVVSGGAGTGKTVLAVEKARLLAQMGQNVLLLCYNRPLADALAEGLATEPNIQVMNFHQLCDRRIRQVLHATGRNLLNEAIEAFPGDSDKRMFDIQLPYALALSNEILEEKWDAVIVDEAQDFSDEYWFAVEELLKDENLGCLFLFIDENQSLYRRHGNLPVTDEPFHLTSNCRNTTPIHQAGYVFYRGEPIDPPEIPGPAVEKVALEQGRAQAEAVITRVGRWVNEEGIRGEDVAVLVSQRSKASRYEILLELGKEAGLAWALESKGRGRRIQLDTVARFKGLEAQGVIVWLGDEVLDEGDWETVYVGLTRAKFLLCVVGSPRMVKALRTIG